MPTLAERYHASVSSLKDAHSRGLSLIWNGFDLGDLMLAEWIAEQIKPSANKHLHGVALIKHQLHAWRQRKKMGSTSLSKDGDVLVFFTSQNQWTNLQPIVHQLEQQGLKILVLSTKPSLLASIPSAHKRKALLLGFKKTNFKAPIAHEMVSLIQRNLPKLNYLYHAIQPYLNNTQLNYVLIGNDNTSEGRLVAKMAQQKNIPTGSIQHGSMNRINPLHGRSVVDQFFVYGEKPKQELVFLGKPAAQIVVKGWPLQTSFHQRKATTWKGFEQPTVVLTFSGPGHGTTEAHHMKCIELVTTLQLELNCQVCIKLHPKDNANYYTSLQPDKTLLWTNADLQQMGIGFHDVVQQAQLVITGASNSALDALLMQTEVITLDLMQAYRDVDFVQDGLVHYCEHYEGLVKVAQRVLSQKKSGLNAQQQEKLETYYHRFFDVNYEPSMAIAQHILVTMKLTPQ